MGQKPLFACVRRGHPAGPDDLSTIVAYHRWAQDVHLPDIHIIEPRFDWELPSPSQVKPLGYQADPQRFEYYSAGRLVRGFARLDSATWQGEPGPITSTDEQHFALVPQGHGNGVGGGPTQ